MKYSSTEVSRGEERDLDIEKDRSAFSKVETVPYCVPALLWLRQEQPRLSFIAESMCVCVSERASMWPFSQVLFLLLCLCMGVTAPWFHALIIWSYITHSSTKLHHPAQPCPGTAWPFSLQLTGIPLIPKGYNGKWAPRWTHWPNCQMTIEKFSDYCKFLSFSGNL